jgi:hypothetical protein
MADQSMRLFFVIAFFAAVCPACAQDSWVAFRDPHGQFIVEMPSMPSEAHTSVTAENWLLIPTVSYSSDPSKPWGVIVSVRDFTKIAANINPEKIVDSVASAIVQTAPRVDVNQTIRLDGQAGRAVAFADSEGRNFENRIYFVRGYLYQVMSVLEANPKADEIESKRRFFESFHFVGP